ncbi:VacJ family lipoprotein [Mesosutterella sp. OilRF-GAM-744-9]|uniref:VacJ family lipoprotein n=1 Tax=Mesosutterella porci TaxID=2915351 RepID=A0ABS9MR42_9BURK|nr:VacJ family lipoprotein [Mesosutterella sp. oilRF-744-WT-GAM-9]MCG5031091.1 VacJ family lipoprotein [Mesosutterella sp. oilRF-744-WT-GAM-9]
MRSLKRLTVVGALAAALMAGGCVSVPANSGENPVDPWETMNRQTFAFNQGFDKYFMRPVAKGYETVTPKPVRSCISNMMDNLTEPRNVLNNALQGKGNNAFVSFMRFVVNSTFGLLGCFDVASMGDLTPKPEDFGQTLGYWGIGNGPYFVIPFLGPSTVRDTVGKGVNWASSIQTWVDPDWAGWAVWGVDVIDTRARLLDMDEVLDTAVDPYTQTRDGYLQYRRNLVYDGEPPEDTFAEDPGDSPAPAQPEASAPAAK